MRRSALSWKWRISRRARAPGLYRRGFWVGFFLGIAIRLAGRLDEWTGRDLVLGTVDKQPASVKKGGKGIDHVPRVVGHRGGVDER